MGDEFGLVESILKVNLDHGDDPVLQPGPPSISTMSRKGDIKEGKDLDSGPLREMHLSECIRFRESAGFWPHRQPQKRSPAFARINSVPYPRQSNGGFAPSNSSAY